LAIEGMTVTNVRGFGRNKGDTEVNRGASAERPDGSLRYRESADASAPFPWLMRWRRLSFVALALS
jgi:hypothetical protein